MMLFKLTKSSSSTDEELPDGRIKITYGDGRIQILGKIGGRLGNADQ